MRFQQRPLSHTPKPFNRSGTDMIFIETKSESIDDLESDIADLDVTIGRRYWTCASCRQAIAKQSGLGPVAMAE